MKKNLAWNAKTANLIAMKPTTSTTSPYSETLSETLQKFVSFVENESNATFEDDPQEMFCFFPPVNYGQTFSKSYPLKSYKGKPTKKWAHMVIYRMESGKYELTNYIL